MGCFGTCFVEYQIMLVSELLTLLGGDLSLKVQIRLISNEQNYHFRVSVVPHVIQPSDQVIKGLASGYVVNQQSTNTATIIAPCYRSKRFLTSRVPNLNFHVCLILQFYGFGPEVNTDR